MAKEKLVIGVEVCIVYDTPKALRSIKKSIRNTLFNVSYGGGGNNGFYNVKSTGKIHIPKRKDFKWIPVKKSNLPEPNKELWLWWHGNLISGEYIVPDDKRIKPYWSTFEGETASLESKVVTHYAEIYEP